MDSFYDTNFLALSNWQLVLGLSVTNVSRTVNQSGHGDINAIHLIRVLTYSTASFPLSISISIFNQEIVSHLNI